MAKRMPKRAAKSKQARRRRSTRRRNALAIAGSSAAALAAAASVYRGYQHYKVREQWKKENDYRLLDTALFRSLRIPTLERHVTGQTLPDYVELPGDGALHRGLHRQEEYINNRNMERQVYANLRNAAIAQGRPVLPIPTGWNNPR